MYPKLALDSQNSSRPCLLSAGITGICQHTTFMQRCGLDPWTVHVRQALHQLSHIWRDRVWVSPSSPPNAAAALTAESTKLCPSLFSPAQQNTDKHYLRNGLLGLTVRAPSVSVGGPGSRSVGQLDPGIHGLEEREDAHAPPTFIQSWVPASVVPPTLKMGL